MERYKIVEQFVRSAYLTSTQEFARWMWENHVQVVALKAEELSQRYTANQDLAVAGAWLHDFGDAFVDRHTASHERVSQERAIEVLKQAGYSDEEVEVVLHDVIEPHSCKDGVLPTSLEGKVLATADALAHLTTDFYLQFCWKHMPTGKDYVQFLEWAKEKLERDFHTKLFFVEVKDEARYRYESLKEVLSSEQIQISSLFPA